jgi:hypothetical protein
MEFIDGISQKSESYLSSSLGKYCVCTPYVTDGKMVQCSSNNCSQKWFHFNCVGIEVGNTEGRYYCPLCCYSKYQTLLMSFELEQEIANADVDVDE